MRRTLACARAATPSPMLLHYRCAVHIYAKQFVMVLNSISKVVKVNPSLEVGDLELVAPCILFALTVDILLIIMQDIRQ